MKAEQTGGRVERDTLGEMEIPADAYYGASTARAIRNFPISGLRFPRPFIYALGMIKRSAAEVNMELGLLDRRVGQAVVQAAQEVADGRFDEHFPIDIYQTGSGTSTNTNANEVIPTAIHLAARLQIRQVLRPALEELARSLAAKAKAFYPIVKTGRTHLMDATPIRLGQEFEGYAGQVERALRRLAQAEEDLGDVPLGGTAVGTGINAHPEFAARACARLSELTGVQIRETTNHFQAQACLDALVFV